MVMIEDEVHAEVIGEFDNWDMALDELTRIAGVPWGSPPNRPPCSSSATCERCFELIDYDTSMTPWSVRRRAYLLRVSAGKVEWLEP